MPKIVYLSPSQGCLFLSQEMPICFHTNTNYTNTDIYGAKKLEAGSTCHKYIIKKVNKPGIL